MLSKSEVLAIKPGDRIVFRSPTYQGCKKATRVVTDSSHCCTQAWREAITARYNGWDHFIVKPAEILEHIPREVSQ